jgi:hypothetical protein
MPLSEGAPLLFSSETEQASLVKRPAECISSGFWTIGQLDGT